MQEMNEFITPKIIITIITFKENLSLVSFHNEAKPAEENL